MQRCFTHYWTNKQWALEESHAQHGYTTIDHTAGNQFSKSGIRTGDVIFIVAVKKGRLFLGGKIVVERLCGQSEAEKILKPPFPLYKAREHIIGTADPDKFKPNLEVPANAVENLYFESADGLKPPKFKSPGVLDQQTLRGIRRLSQRASELLNDLL